MKIILTRWLPFILYAGLIFYVSSGPLPELPAPMQFDHVDLIAHALEYALFAWLAYRFFYRPDSTSGRAAGMSTSFLQRHVLFVTLLISILYGFSDEFHQYYVPGRQMDVFDFLFDTLGAVVVVGILKIGSNKPQITRIKQI